MIGLAGLNWSLIKGRNVAHHMKGIHCFSYGLKFHIFSCLLLAIVYIFM